MERGKEEVRKREKRGKEGQGVREQASACTPWLEYLVPISPKL